MKRPILLILSALLLSAGRVHAYTQAYVYIHSAVEGGSDEGEVLQQLLLGRLTSSLVRHYTCLHVMDSVGLKDSLNFIRQQQLLGTDEAKVENELSNIQGMMDMKYLIIIKITAMKELNFYQFNIIAKNKKKTGFPFYTESEVFRSYGAATAAVDKTADHLIEGFTKYLSDEREYRGGEICPVKGPVTVTVETKRDQKHEEVASKYCNGGTWQWKKTDYTKVSSKETWKLERYGIPDAKGTMEGSYVEESGMEEFDACHECASGKKAQWRFTRASNATKTVSGLSDKSATSDSDNKDAAVRLHFQDDDTYTITVAATSAKGKMYSNFSESAEGSCDVEHKKQTLPGTFTRPMEYTFEGFRGTPYDTRLKETKQLRFYDKDKEEETIVTIDFDLSRPTINQ
ncbi:MAG: hypothetical protein C4530_21455 [Desulfobacteraceae bacterium]|nr:MAG: hypothetical protein C4530_21455 [Desulfobacteraceae bacterium]